MSGEVVEKRCFLDSARRCAPVCMSYEDDSGKPGCVLLLAVNGVIGFAAGWAKARVATVKHPASPPAPEVT